MKVDEYREYPFVIEWQVKYKTPSGWKWSKWRHVRGFRTDEERQKGLDDMKLHPDKQKVRLVNYKEIREIYPRSGR